MKNTIIRADVPFCGRAESYLNTNGTVAFSDGLTLEEYEKRCGYPLKLVTEEEFEQLFDTMITEPKAVDHERYCELLSVLPPCRWHTYRGVELFHVSEHLAGPLVTWIARLGDRHFEWIDRADASSDLLAFKVSKA